LLNAPPAVGRSSTGSIQPCEAKNHIDEFARAASTPAVGHRLHRRQSGFAAKYKIILMNLLYAPPAVGKVQIDRSAVRSTRAASTINTARL